MATTPTRNTLDVRREVKACPSCQQRFSRDAAFCPFDGVKLETAEFDPLADPLVGTRVDGRYDVVSILGEGGMGRIYRVRHAALDRPFAMKVLRPELAREPDLASRFILEAKATASVKHPNVVQITDFGRFPDGVPFLVMELLVGHTLGEVIKAGGPIPASRAVRIIRKVAGALAAAHAANVVHRDLKPDNVFLVGGARDVTGADDPDRGRSMALLSYGADVRVVDFGAAKIVGASRLTRAGVVFGTPHYMSPEQASGQELDHRADIYSLGVIMYEMFTGRVPFESDTYMGVLTQHMFVQPVPPSQIPGAANELGALEEITLKCLAKKPDERYASMDDLVRAIDQVVHVRDDGAPPTPSSAWSTAMGSAAAGASSVRPRMADELELPSFDEMRMAIDAARPLGGKAPWIALVSAIGIAAGALGAVYWPRSGERAQAPAALAPVAPSSTVLAGPTPSPTPTPTPWAAPVPIPATVLPVTPATGVSAAPSGHRAAEAGTGSSSTPRSRPPRPGASLQGEMDDVGDPFAGKH